MNKARNIDYRKENEIIDDLSKKKTLEELQQMDAYENPMVLIALAIKYEHDKEYDKMLEVVNKGVEMGVGRAINYLGIIYEDDKEFNENNEEVSSDSKDD